MPRYVSTDDFQVELHNMGLIDKSGWIRASITNMNIILAKCTAYVEPVEGYPLWMHCPNCGARMDEVIEDA